MRQKTIRLPPDVCGSDLRFLIAKRFRSFAVNPRGRFACPMISSGGLRAKCFLRKKGFETLFKILMLCKLGIFADVQGSPINWERSQTHERRTFRLYRLR